MAEHQVAGYQVVGYQMMGHRMAGYQVAGHQVVRYRMVGPQVASCGSWGAGLGSDAGTRSRHHTPDCRSPETVTPGVVHSPSYLCYPHPPTAVRAERVPPGPVVSLRIRRAGAQPSTAHHGTLGSMPTGQATQGPTL